MANKLGSALNYYSHNSRERIGYHVLYAQLEWKKSQAPQPNEDILEGLENYDPHEENHKANLSYLTALALKQDDHMCRTLFDNFLEIYRNETRTRKTIDETDAFGRGTLHWVVGARCALGYQRMVEWRADLNVQTTLEGFSAVMVACRDGGDPKAVEFLLKHGADPNLESYTSATAFHIATASGSKGCMRVLAMNGGDPKAVMWDGRSAFDLAADKTTHDLIHSCIRSATIYEEKSTAKCAFCETKHTNLQRCGKCFVVFYCCRKCQLNHWKMEHREQCVGSMSAVKTTTEPSVQEEKIDSSDEMKSSNQRLPENTSISKTSAAPEKTFVVEAIVKSSPDGTEAKKIEISNEHLKVKAQVVEHEDNTIFQNFVQYIIDNGEGSKHSVYFWAKINEASANELVLFYGKKVPRQEMKEKADIPTYS